MYFGGLKKTGINTVVTVILIAVILLLELIGGSIFIIIGAALAVVNMVCFVLNRINMDKEKRMRIKVIICASGILLVFYWMIPFPEVRKLNTCPNAYNECKMFR